MSNTTRSIVSTSDDENLDKSSKLPFEFEETSANRMREAVYTSMADHSLQNNSFVLLVFIHRA